MMWQLLLGVLSLQVETGLDRLIQNNFKPLEGKTVVVLTNHTALDKNGSHLLSHLKKQKGFQIKALMSPEHGFKGVLDEEGIKDAQHDETGLTIYSLYGKTKRPTSDMLKDVDLLLFDIQDIGTRFYTYQTTLLYAMEACTENGVAIMVLDRPNPIGGVRCDGPVLDPDRFSFTGAFPMPVIHGMTMGELALMFKGENNLKLDLQIMKMQGWERTMTFDRTGLMWINPSPNMRNQKQALLYPAIGLLEFTNLSVGRGTDTPFEHFGASWLDPLPFCAALNDAGLPGVTFVPQRFTPTSGPYANTSCGGVYIHLRDTDAFEPIATSYTIHQLLIRHYPDHYQKDKYLRLLGSKDIFNALAEGVPLAGIRQTEADQRKPFLQTRAKYLIYR